MFHYKREQLSESAFEKTETTQYQTNFLQKINTLIFQRKYFTNKNLEIKKIHATSNNIFIWNVYHRKVQTRNKKNLILGNMQETWSKSRFNFKELFSMSIERRKKFVKHFKNCCILSFFFEAFQTAVNLSHKSFLEK